MLSVHEVNSRVLLFTSTSLRIHKHPEQATLQLNRQLPLRHARDPIARVKYPRRIQTGWFVHHEAVGLDVHSPWAIAFQAVVY